MPSYQLFPLKHSFFILSIGEGKKERKKKMMESEPPPPKEELDTITLTDPLSVYESAISNPAPPLSPAVRSPRSPQSPQSDRPSSHRLSYYQITVTDPRKDPEPTVAGPTSVVTYSITSTPTTGSREPAVAVSVRRRFRDFVTLSDRLAESHRGFFVPPRPEKNSMESRTMRPWEFLERRRSGLEKYLRKLAAHPAVGKSEELRVFLRAEGRMPLVGTTDAASRMLDGAVRLPRQLMGGEGVSMEEMARPAKAGRDLLRMLKELKQTVANEFGGAKPAMAEEDREFLERKERVLDLEQHLAAASQQAENLVKCQHDIGETMGELGLAFIKLVKFENEEAIHDSQRIRAAEAKRVATAAVKASRYYRGLNAQTVKHLDTLHDYLGIMMAVRGAFSDRSNALLTVQTLMSDLSSLHGRAEKQEAASSKIFGGDKSRICKLEEMRKTIKVTEDAKSCALKEYERIRENNRYELERLDAERPEDFLSMLKGLVENQVRYAEKISSVWATVAEETVQYVKDKTLSV